MPKRRADADSRRFFDEFEKVRISRFRATGVVDPSSALALIPFPSGKVKLIGAAHVAFARGGGWSYFVCPHCGDRRCVTLYLIDDAPRCRRCCNAMNIRLRSEYGFGRDTRRRASDRHLDEIIAKLETTEPLRFKPAPEAWWGRKRVLDASHALTHRMRRNMISLRLGQLASQQAKERDKLGYQPLAASRQLIEIKPIWRARNTERLQRALDKAQSIIISALKSDDPKKRLAAAKLMLRTKNARDRGVA